MIQAEDKAQKQEVEKLETNHANKLGIKNTYDGCREDPELGATQQNQQEYWRSQLNQLKVKSLVKAEDKER